MQPAVSLLPLPLDGPHAASAAEGERRGEASVALTSVCLTEKCLLVACESNGKGSVSENPVSRKEEQDSKPPPEFTLPVGNSF